jgi:hypothetical protein
MTRVSASEIGRHVARFMIRGSEGHRFEEGWKLLDFARALCLSCVEAVRSKVRGSAWRPKSIAKACEGTALRLLLGKHAA